MSDSGMINTGLGGSSRRSFSVEIRTEIFRKSIHMAVAFVPFFAGVNFAATAGLLAIAAVGYSVCEFLRLSGRSVALVSGITSAASRTEDEGRFVMGPVTLVIGTMLALLLYPLPAAAMGIYALAFGDSAASLAGKLFGRIRIPFAGGKTLEGSLACYFTVFVIAMILYEKPLNAAAVALTAAAIEMIPVRNLDNLMIPLAAGFTAVLLV